jgi:hypothetical protein
MEQRWNNTDRGKHKVWETKLSQPQMGVNLGLQAEKQATNCLSDDTIILSTTNAAQNKIILCGGSQSAVRRCVLNGATYMCVKLYQSAW